MRAPDRPTREQVDAALAHLDVHAMNVSTLDVIVLGAEVRALRLDVAGVEGERDAADDFAASVRDLLGVADEPGWGWEVDRRIRAALAARTPEPAAALDAAHFARQAAFSAKTFGPGPLTAGVLDHIRKELAEIEAAPLDLGEWVDVMILAADGAWRAGHEPQAIVDAVIAKQRRNESRTWPDWRTAAPGKAIEHDRSTDAAQLPAVPDGEDVAVRRRWAAWLVESAAQADDLTESEAQGMRIAATHLLDDEIAARADRIDGLDGEWLAAFTERLHDRIEAHRFAVQTVRAAAAIGEDVPARLAAAADVLAKISGAAAGDFRHAANVLAGASPELRAAVAAALALPTETQK